MKRLWFNRLALASVTFFSLAEAWGQSRPLTLKQAVSYALEHNRGVQVQGLEQQRTALALTEARSYLRPTVSAAGSYLHYFDRQVIFLPGAFAGNATEPVTDLAVGGRNALAGALTVTQPLLAQPARERVKAAAVYENMTQYQVAQVRMETIRQVSRSYYQAVLLTEKLALLRQSIQRNEQALRDARSLLAQGRALRSDTLSTYLNVQNLRPAFMQLASDITVAKSQLNTQMGMPAETELLLEDTLNEAPPMEALPALAEAREFALQARPDIKRQALLLQAHQREIAAVVAERLPTIAAIGQYQLQAQADSKPLTRYRWPATSFVGAQVAVPIFSGHRLDARAGQAQAALQQAELQLQQLQAEVDTELLARLAQAQNARSRWQLQAQNEVAARLNYEVIRSRFQQGLATRLEVTDAEFILSQTRLQRVQVLHDLHMSQVELDYALGRLTS